jgi:hypothetical protein
MRLRTPVWIYPTPAVPAPAHHAQVCAHLQLGTSHVHMQQLTPLMADLRTLLQFHGGGPCSFGRPLDMLSCNIQARWTEATSTRMTRRSWTTTRSARVSASHASLIRGGEWDGTSMRCWTSRGSVVQKTAQPSSCLSLLQCVLQQCLLICLLIMVKCTQGLHYLDTSRRRHV